MIQCVPVHAYALARVCDGCSAVGPHSELFEHPVDVPTGIKPGPDSLAAQAGWYVSAEKDFCPTCRKTISAQRVTEEVDG